MRRRFLFEKNLNEKDKQNLDQIKALSKGIKKDQNEPVVLNIPENVKIAEIKNLPKNALAKVNKYPENLKLANEKVTSVLNVNKPLNLTKADTKDLSNPNVPVEIAKTAARFNIDIKNKPLRQILIEIFKAQEKERSKK